MRFTRPRDQHETPRTSADRTRPDRVRTDLTCDTGGCHGTGACLHTGTCHHTGGCHQTSADDPSLPIAHRDLSCRSVLSRRSVLGAGVGAGALALTGCAGVPTEGPVERVNSPGPAAGQDPIDVNPRPPEPGASRELIVAGFLQAMSSSTDAYRSARAYLTDEAAQHWDPHAGALIYDSEFHKPTVDDDRAVLHAPLIATLDASGHHDLCGHGFLDHDFALVKVAGQWRVSAPPTGLLLSLFAFERGYHTTAIYFLGRVSGLVAPDVIHLPQAEANPTNAVKALLAGPPKGGAAADGSESIWYSGIPSSVELSSESISIDANGVATVPLNARAARLSPDELRVMAAQFTWTLSQFSQVSRVRFTARGVPLTLADAAEDGTVSLDLFASMAAYENHDKLAVTVVRGGTLQSLVSDETFRPLSGSLGTLRPSAISPSAISPSTAPSGTIPSATPDHQWALVDQRRTGLWWWCTGARTARKLASGTAMVRPQITRDHTIWTVEDTGSVTPVVHAVTPAGRPRPVNATALRRTRIRAFSISPDMTRIAFILGEGEGSRLAMSTLGKDSSGMLVIGQPEVRVVAEMDPGMTIAIDVGWISQTKLMVIARSAVGASGTPFELCCDGAEVTPVGQLTGANMVQLATVASADTVSAVVMTESGHVLRYEYRYRWTQLGEDASITAVSLSG